MMHQQARESLRPVFGVRHPLRAYASNSPRAQARLLVLALLADGQLDEREIDTLDRQNILADLGIARPDFAEVLSDFCSDVAGQLPLSSGGYQLTPNALSGMLDEISDPALRERLLRHMLALVKSDGQLSEEEKHLLGTTLTHWQPRQVGGKRMPEQRRPLD